MINLEELYQLDRELYKDINLKNSSVAFQERKERIFEWMKENGIETINIHFYFDEYSECLSILWVSAYNSDEKGCVVDESKLSGFMAHPLTDGRIRDCGRDRTGDLIWKLSTKEIIIKGKEQGWVPFDTIIF
jgi:hypothetical protein